MMDFVHFRRHQHPVEPAEARHIARMIPDAEGVGAHAHRDEYHRIDADKSRDAGEERLELSVEKEPARGGGVVELMG